MQIVVTAPATTANLGPGFDCLGAALGFGLELRALTGPGGGWTVADHFDEVDAARPPRADVVLRAAQAVAGDLPPMRLEMHARIPVGRGLGSSAAATAAGLLLGCALAGREPEPSSMLELGLPIEGHPDNLSACLFGGLTLTLPSGAVMRFAPSAPVRPVVLVPPLKVPTKRARGVLPASVPRADAVATAARTAGLLAMLSGMSPVDDARLLECTEDVLHQRQRAPLMPETADLISSLRSRGVAAVVSGAGPSILCLASGPVAAPDGWRVLDPGWGAEGARLRVTGGG